MIRLFTLRLLVLYLTLILLVSGSIAYGRRHSSENPLETLGFNVCGNRPCLVGIVPGETSWNDARTRLAPGNDNEISELYTPVNDTQATVMPGFDQVAIISIKAYSDTSLPVLGYFIQKYGSPCGVLIHGDFAYSSDIVELRYSLMTLDVNLSQSRLNIYSTVDFVQLLEPSITFEAPQNLCKSDPYRNETLLPWLGFASLEHYKARGLPLAEEP